MKKLLFTSGASLLSITAMSQDAGPVTQGFWNDPLLPFYLTAAAVAAQAGVSESAARDHS